MKPLWIQPRLVVTWVSLTQPSHGQTQTLILDSNGRRCTISSVSSKVSSDAYSEQRQQLNLKMM